ncbi:hypothetical protein AKJ51_00630 [candidate division MSBL1 archaeon SCGC-AAA382A20]|uniref:PKD domain-containing protein n=1 Tax=candidate division MSBL1 archaeon SCGC-AAA382A20 TaxID=1698280 RepID=A0A133VMQ1_9EURY|nr:hypothetical protein AKJ51_00630 [candidate division MSBL1 archaeon SCGC-AAA382A20]
MSSKALTLENLHHEDIDLEEMLPSSEAGMTPRENENLVIKFTFNPNAGNEYQGDFLTADITFGVKPSTPNDPPSAHPNGPYTVPSGDSIELDGTESEDPDGDPLTYLWEIKNDPTGEATLTNPESEKPTFNAPDVDSETEITVKLTVDDGKYTDTETTKVTVKSNSPPTAAFKYSPSGEDLEIKAGEAGITVDFDASGSSDPDGSIESYDWKFGDGSNGTGKTTSHTYTEEGCWLYL